MCSWCWVLTFSYIVSKTSIALVLFYIFPSLFTLCSVYLHLSMTYKMFPWIPHKFCPSLHHELDIYGKTYLASAYLIRTGFALGYNMFAHFFYKYLLTNIVDHVESILSYITFLCYNVAKLAGQLQAKVYADFQWKMFCVG